MPDGKKVIPKPWWYPWGEAQWRQDPRSKGMVKLKPGVWGPPRPPEPPVFFAPGYTPTGKMPTEWDITPEGKAYLFSAIEGLPPDLQEAYRRGEISLSEIIAWLNYQKSLGAEQAAQEAPQQLTPWQKAQLEQQERQWKARELARPENWIERWFYENMPAQPPPWTRGGGTVIGQVSAEGVPLGWESPRLQERARIAAEEMRTPEEGVVYDPAELAAAGLIPTEKGGEPAGVWGWPGVYASGPSSGGKYTPIQLGGGAPEPPRPKAPPAPSWLPTFVPGLEVGKPITKQPALTVSGQQAQQITPEQWQGLSGYLGWAGVPGQAASLQDYIARMEAMYPGAQARRPQWGRTRSYV